LTTERAGIALILLHAPDWAKVTAPATRDSIRVLARPRHLSGAPARAYDLRVSVEASIRVAEWKPGVVLPARCPERHVNFDGSFCLGLTPIIPNSDGALDFWAKLRGYLLCQDFAAECRRWPTGRWLSHGAAAEHQIEAEDAARRAGLAERYRAALEFKRGFLAGPLPDVQPRARPSTERRLAIEDLICAERRRRAAEASFARWWVNNVARCCGTMDECPIRDLEADCQAVGSGVAEGMGGQS
jgi:hypothetical protein